MNKSILSQSEIDYFFTLPEVINAKMRIDSENTRFIYFSVELPESIKDILNRELGLNLYGVQYVPMRWIKGDTSPHIDNGNQNFTNTYLTYLTDSTGEFILENETFPIQKGTAFVFQEGIRHETVGTGLEPRLLLGPMSEYGLPVGASLGMAGGNTIYFRQNGNEIQYSIDNQSSWIGLGNNFPLNIANYDTYAGILKVEFTTDITIDDSYGSGIYKYFVCGSSNIQFGSTSLKGDGTRPKIIVAIDNYDGFIENGTESSGGNNNIYVYNLVVDGTGHTPQIGAGWIGKKGFGNGASNNFFIGCASLGNLPGGAVGSGGISGSFTGINSGNVVFRGCSSSGSIGQLDGGIVGAHAGENGGYVLCEQCWSTGIIQAFGGGIFGDYAINTEAVQCYSTGSIGNSAGGIYSRYAGYSGQAFANKCYSQGNIDTDGGGIFGIGAGSSSGMTIATNSYSSGTITTSGRGIYGSGKASGTEINCYSANGSWSSFSANTALQGVPSGTVGTTWVSTGLNQPYELNNMGYTPYTTSIITGTSTLLKTYSATVEAGEDGPSAIVSGKSYSILQGGDNTISINSNTGTISTTLETVPGVYTIYIRNTGSYNITTFTLTVQNNQVSNEPICFPAGTPVLTDQGEIDIDRIKIKEHTIGGKPVIAITQTILPDKYLICLEKDCLGENMPTRRTLISREHKILYKNKMVKSGFLLGRVSGIYRVQNNSRQLYNVLQEEYSTMVVNGIIVETLDPQNILAQIYNKSENKSQRIQWIKLLSEYNSKKKVGMHFLRDGEEPILAYSSRDICFRSKK